jgi:hypothetical protein
VPSNFVHLFRSCNQPQPFLLHPLLLNLCRWSWHQPCDRRCGHSLRQVCPLLPFHWFPLDVFREISKNGIFRSNASLIVVQCLALGRNGCSMLLYDCAHASCRFSVLSLEFFFFVLIIFVTVLFVFIATGIRRWICKLRIAPIVLVRRSRYHERQEQTETVRKM